MWASHGGTMSVAIDVTYHRDENMLLFNPVAEIALLHSTPEPAATLDAVSLPASRNPTGVVLPGAQGSRLDIVVNFSIALGDQPFGASGGSVGFGVLCDGDVTLPAADACAANASFLIDGAGQGHLAVGRTILVNSSDALKGQANSSSFCTPTTCPRVAVPIDGQISLRLLVDGSSLELYANGGRAVVDGLSVGGSVNLARAAAGGVRLFLNASSSAAPVRASAAAWHMECGDMKRCPLPGEDAAPPPRQSRAKRPAKVDDESVRRDDPDQELCQGYVERVANETWREPAGVLRYPYLVPAGPYQQCWDWDSVFLGTATLRLGAGRYFAGSMQNFLAAVVSHRVSPCRCQPLTLAVSCLRISRTAP